MVQALVIKLSDVYKTFISKALGILSANKPLEHSRRLLGGNSAIS